MRKSKIFNMICDLKHIVLLFLLFILVCCNANKKKGASYPDWVVNIDKNCPENYICTVGEGVSVLEASANARNEIAKQFSVNIKSTFSSSIYQRNDITDRDVLNSVNENASEIISGIKIEKTYVDINNGRYYILATLDKVKMSREIKIEIDKIDNTLQNLIQQKPVKLKTAKDLIKNRLQKAQKYYFLTNVQLKEKVTIEDVLKAKAEPTLYKIDIEDNENFGLKNIVIGQIIDHNDKVDDNARKIIKGKISINNAYLKVSGFEKYEVNIILKCIENKETIGKINYKIYETGRNKEQVLNKIKDDVIMMISNSIDSLLV